MQDNWKQNCPAILFLIALAVAIGTLWYADRTVQVRTPELTESAVAVCREGWYQAGTRRGVDPSDLSDTGYPESRRLLKLEYALPEAVAPGTALMFESNNERVTVFVGDEKIYSGGEFDGGRMGNSFGRMWNLVLLPEDCGGERLVVELQRLRDWMGSTSMTFFMGNRDALILRLYRQKAPKLLLLMAVSMLALSFALKAAFLRRWRMQTTRGLAWLAAFVMLVAVWCFTDDNFGQLLNIPKELNYIACNSAFMLLPAPMLLFMRELFPRYRRLFTGMFGVTLAYYLTRLAMFLAFGLHLDRWLPLAHAMQLSAVAILVVICVREWKERSSRILLAGILTLLAFYAVAIPAYYLQTVQHWQMAVSYNTLIFMGLSLFVVFMYLGLQNSAQAVYRKASLSDALVLQAYTDMMTGVGNRSACDARLRELERNFDANRPVTLIMADLNNLKETNDRFGHEMGDVLLRNAAMCMTRAFSPIGDVYRVGGDEFIVTIADRSRAEVEDAVRQFWLVVSTHNQLNPHPIAVAMGCARRDDTHPVATMQELRARADQDMYQNKSCLKRGERPDHWMYR